MRFHLKCCLIVIFVGSWFQLFSQDTGTSSSGYTQQLWLDFQPHFFITEKLEFNSDGGFRATVNNDSWKRLFIRPSFRYHYADYLKFYGGIGLFYIDNDETFNTFELRPWQGVYARWPRTKRVLFDHLLRFEERFNWQSKSNDGLDFQFRTRYKLTSTILFCQPCGDQYWSMPISGEFILPVGESSTNVYKNNFRFAAGVSYKYSKNWVYSLNFIWQQSTTSITDRDNASDQIFQLKVGKLLK